MIVISSALVLAEVQTYDADNPVIGWHNVVVAENITADTEDADFPAVNLANPNTALEWRGADTTEQYVSILTDYVDEVSYLGVARHNFGSEQIVVSVEGREIEGGSWVEICDEVMLADDTPVLFRFDPQSLFEIRLRMQSGLDVPRAAVIYVGTLLVMERGLYAGHTPLAYAPVVDVIDGAAESGDFLGNVIVGEYRESAAAFSLLSPAWFRSNFVPFLNSAALLRLPFFFAWRPATYPLESGFARLMNNPRPTPDGTSHLIEVELVMRGVP